MPRFRFTLENPDLKGIQTVKEIFISNDQLVEKFLPFFHELNLKAVDVEEVHSVFEKQVLQAQLDNGEPVDLMNFSFHLTYSDLIEGSPDKEINEFLLESLQTKFKPDYIPTHVRRPSEDQVKGELPVFYGVAEWTCYQKSHEAGQSSELRVVWFIDEVPQGLAFRQMLQDSLKGLDWDQYAEEYDPGDL